MKTLSPSTKGAINELIACTWLLQQGYMVFRNVAADGPVDLIIEKDKQLTRIDVKSIMFRYKGKPLFENAKVKQQQANGIRVLLVSKEGNCFWADELV